MDARHVTPALNPRLIDTATPPIPEARAWVERYDGSRGPLIDLSQAAPHTPPPLEMLERLSAAAADPAIARYGPIEGDLALREALARDITEVYAAYDFGPSNIAITAGCNQAFVVTAMTIAKAGDAIILPSPWYFNHKMALDMLGVEARPLLCQPQNGFAPNVDDAERLIDERTRAIVLVTPNNPTGAVYPPEIIGAFAELCRARSIWLIIDETYRDFLPTGVDRPHNLFTREDWCEHAVHLYSFSKSYAIPGYRLGAVMAAPWVMEQVAKCLDTLQICPARIGQVATAWAVEALRDWRAGNRADVNARADAFSNAMNRAAGWRIESIGAYFAFVRHPFNHVPALKVAERLAVERGVLSLPGPWFGPSVERYLRVAFANASEGALDDLPARLAGLELR